jgi:hypothetical protein
MNIRVSILFLALGALAAGCGAGTTVVENDKFLRDIRPWRSGDAVTSENAAEVLKVYTIPFSIPNPLYGETSVRQTDPVNQSTISCRATLLDSISTAADIFLRCRMDSLDAAAGTAFAGRYRRDNLRENTFRIRITMETAFSEKSLEPRHWAMYVETADGVLVEPSDIEITPSEARADTTGRRNEPFKFGRRMYARDMTLYFKQVTFFGADLLGPDNPYLLFVMSRERNEIARIAWRHAAEKASRDK